MKNNYRSVRDTKKQKNMVLGAGLGMIFGAAMGNIAIGLVLGAGGGLLVESFGKKLSEK